MENKMCAGFHSEVITPYMGMNIDGYYTKRYADGIETDLMLRCAAFACGEQKVVIFNCEMIGIKADAFDQIKVKIAEKCEISQDAIFINCIHSHTSSRIYAADPSTNVLDIYLNHLNQKFADCAWHALRDLKPCTLEMAVGEAKNAAFVRKYRMADGTAKTNPKTLDPQIVAPIGKPDESVPVIRVIREDAEDIVIVGFSTHADMIGGTKFTPDWPGYLVRLVDRALENEVHTMFLLGPEGNVGTRNPMDPSIGVPGTKGVARAKAMARRVAAEVLRLYDMTTPVESDSIAFAHKYVQVGKNSYDPEQLPMVEELVKIYREKGEAAEELKNYPMHYREALRIKANLSRPEFFDLRISGIRLGDIAFVGIPGEPFASIGLDIKAASPIARTVVTACTNGHEGYYPDEDSYNETGYSYERAVSPFASNCAQVLTEGALDVLKQLQK